MTPLQSGFDNGIGTKLPKGARIAKSAVLRRVGLPGDPSPCCQELQSGTTHVKRIILEAQSQWWSKDLCQTCSCESLAANLGLVCHPNMLVCGAQAAVEVDLYALPTPTTPRHNIRICPTNRALSAANVDDGRLASMLSQVHQLWFVRMLTQANTALVSRICTRSFILL